MTPSSLHIFASSGVLSSGTAVQRARTRLRRLGFEVTVDPSVRARHQRFAGSDEQRLETLHRVAHAAPRVALAARGGYGMTRLLDRIDWPLMARSVDAGTQWVGYSDLTALQLGLLAHTGRASWHGPMAADDFGYAQEEPPEVLERREHTAECFVEAVSGQLEALGFQTGPGHDGLECRGTLWGGNLSMVCSLLGTPHWPQVRGGGILILEDVGEHPYRVERMLLQLDQAGVLARQRAIVLGAFSGWNPSPLDRGFRLTTVLGYLRSRVRAPILDGLPFGHVPLKLTLPIGRRTRLAVQGRSAWLGWDHESA